ncbi:MAG: polysaccharide biosynthesis/export family protein [Planctomycetes bacterium]|nr:polysaccharide biosynthesis/export family protein [Planctomycetota bacterium]
MTARQIVPFMLVIVSVSFIAGCFSSNPEDIQVFLKPSQADVTMDNYILQPPDEVTVIASNIPELQSGGSQVGQTQVIRPDGKISFENIGEVHVAGKNPRQVAKIISDRLIALYKLTGEHPVDVRVENQSKLYYVVGMVQRPGAQVFTGRETTLSAISKAIPNNLAWKEKIQVIRPSSIPGGPSKVFALDFKSMVEQGRMEQNVLLQEGDVIYVPPTIFASIGLTVGEILSPVLQGASAAAAFAAP